MNHMEFKTIADEDEPRTVDNRPNACLAIVINEYTYWVLGHEGPYLYAMEGEAGMNGEELGLDDVPGDPGYYVLEDGEVWEGQDRETGMVDECGLSGTWRRACRADFDRFDVDYPIDDKDAPTPQTSRT